MNAVTTPDLRQPVAWSEDPFRLLDYFNRLLRFVCTDLRVSYGGTLHLEMATKYVAPRLVKADLRRAKRWLLSGIASPWRVTFRKPKVVVEHPEFRKAWQDHYRTVAELPWRDELCATPKAIGPEKAEAAFQRAVGKRVSRVHLASFPLPAPRRAGVGVLLHLGNTASILTIPNIEPDDPGDEFPLSDVELYTPTRMYLRVGPGLRWAYLRADLEEQSVPNVAVAHPE